MAAAASDSPHVRQSCLAADHSLRFAAIAAYFGIQLPQKPFLNVSAPSDKLASFPVVYPEPGSGILARNDSVIFMHAVTTEPS